MASQLSGCGFVDIEQSRRRFDNKKNVKNFNISWEAVRDSRARQHVFIIQAPCGSLKVLEVSWKARQPSLKFQNVQKNNKNTSSTLI